MKHSKYIVWYIIGFVILIAIIIAVFFNGNNKENNNSSYETEKTSANNTTNSDNTNQENNVTHIPVETELSTFSTNIYTKESGRQHNMELTASRLNNHIVKNGETFSFCSFLGPSSSEKGYQKADIFDNQGNKKKGIGGGNCQISSTLYNAVLAVPNLTVVERHAHSNYVPYVQRGKDAAVAYGSYDLKFRNDTGKDIKLVFIVTNNLVTATIFQLD